jgi:hypothetical protein
MRSLVAAAAIAAAALIPATASAAVELGGFAQANYAVDVADPPCVEGGPCDVLLADQRVQLKAEGASEKGSSGYAAKVDLFYDSVAKRSDVEVREVFVDLTGAHASLRAGRQIVTWGVGDLLFTNDIFPKDWVAFFTGRPLEYLKVASDAVKVDLHPKAFDAEIVLMPVFQADRYPTADKLHLPDPFPGLPRITEDKDASIENGEAALRLSRYVSDWGLSLYASRTFYRSPAMTLDSPTTPTAVLQFFPRLNTYGASATGSLLGGVASLEGALWDSREDQSGTRYAVENSTVKALAGYSYPLWKDATLGVQGYVEWMLDYNAYRATARGGYPVKDEKRWTATTRITQLLRNQTVTGNLFAFWGLTEEDGLVIPSVRYAATDNVSVELGANLFYGKANYTQFGALNEDDNVYTTLRYAF